MIKSSVFTFKVDDSDRIYPQFDMDGLTDIFQSTNKVLLELWGHKDCSFIFMDWVTKFFENYLKSDIEFEWKFIENHSGKLNELSAQLNVF